MTRLEERLFCYSILGLASWVTCTADHINTRKNILRECKDLRCVARICGSTPILDNSDGPGTVFRAHFNDFLDYRNVWILTKSGRVTEVHVDDRDFEEILINTLYRK